VRATELSVAIQHAPWADDRRRWVAAMLDQLHAEAPELRVRVVADHDREGCWPTFRRALRPGPGCSHHLVLQDDLELCDEFVATLLAAIRSRPDAILNLYTSSDIAPLALARGHAWLEKPGVAGPSMLWPAELIEEFLDWQARHVVPEFEYDTVRVSMWLIKTGRKAYATVPSLTQHLGAVSSTLGLNDEDKIALCYERGAGPKIDWTRGLQTPTFDKYGIAETWWEHFRECAD